MQRKLFCYSWLVWVIAPKGRGWFEIIIPDPTARGGVVFKQISNRGESFNYLKYRLFIDDISVKNTHSSSAVRAWNH